MKTLCEGLGSEKAGNAAFCGLRFLCNVSRCGFQPPLNVACRSPGRQVCAAAALSSVCKPKRERSGEKRKKQLLTGGFCVCPSGINGTPSKAWLMAQENAMCPTDGPSKNEGASCADGQFCLGRVWRQIGKSAEA